jgi:tRNA(adenine34) deaminase
MTEDEHWIEQALELADEARKIGEVPVGALVVLEGSVVGRGMNSRERDRDPLAHAELVAIAEAAKTLGRWRLSDCTLYVTLEPCPMCAGAIVNARIGTVVFGARDPRAGAMLTHYGIGRGLPLNHTVAVREGVLAEPCGRILSEFFQAKRKG